MNGAEDGGVRAEAHGVVGVDGGVRLLPFGDRAVLAEVASLAEVLALHARLAASRPAGVVDLVPAARTVLVHVDPAVLPLARARTWIATAADAPAPPRREGTIVELPIVYDGADLEETASLLGVDVDELARRHAACTWTVAFTGFAPGFGYLVSDDWPFDVPRRASPRTRVPAGAVGLAGAFSGAYPRETPGGWQLVGTTSALLFDQAAATPALLAPGARVRFVPRAAEPPALSPAPASASALASAPRGLGKREAGLEVVAVGGAATVQDLGRPGHAGEGVARSGAADRAALRTANRLVGNREDAAGLELTVGGFRAVARSDVWFAVAGAWGPLLLDGRAVDPYEAHAWPAGAQLEVGAFAHGVRAYLAVRGGIAGSATAGSRATDTLAGLGPAPLRPGDRLAVADEADGPIPVSTPPLWGAPADDVIELDLAPGPRADWLTASARALLFDATWSVSPQSDRVGVRLDGPELARARDGELPSEGMLPGAVQVPPDGRPVVFGVDGPVTGGYPVVAVVTDASRDALAQARPGTRVRFRHARPAR